MAEEKKLGLRSVISVSVGLVIATSCLVSLGQGAGTIGVIFIVAMVIACLLNMTTIASLSELNALMPNTTGGLAQYTLASMGPFPTLISMVGGYLLCNVLSSGVEASIFAYAMEQTFHLPIPRLAYSGSGCLSFGRFDGFDGNYWSTWPWYWKNGSSANVYGNEFFFRCFNDSGSILAVYWCRVCDPDFEGSKKCKEKCTTWYDAWINYYLCGTVGPCSWFS